MSGYSHSDECRLESLNGAFGGIYAMIVGFNDLQSAIVLGKELLDVLGSLIVHYV
jgi:hypothetical protein